MVLLFTIKAILGAVDAPCKIIVGFLVRKAHSEHRPTIPKRKMLRES